MVVAVVLSGGTGRGVAAGAVLGALLMAGAGCGDGRAGGTSLTKVTYRGPFVTSGGDAPLYYADELGYFEEEGLDVAIRDSKGSGQTVTDVGNGGSDFGMAAATNLIMSIDRGQQVVGAATYLGRSSFGFFVPADSGIASIQNLRGRSIAVSALVEQNMYAALAAAGLAKSDVKPVVADANALVTTYVSGKADAMYTVRSFLPQTRRRASNVLMQSDAGFNPPDYVLVVTKKTMRDRPQLVRSFARATLRGFQAAKKDPDAAIKALTKEHPELDPKQSLGVLKAVLGFMCAPTQSGRPYGENAPADWKGTVEALKRTAGLRGTGTYFDNALFKEGGGLGSGTC
ncbi:ABC-type nitrate/sulfonate/bicarbonate transport system, substrate-binding protein [Actinomadura meyerae]|uniref:Thiamine pyrimidine synthase n=1 Tax=Actinomadura meyerae TaxID=240840 RepID=A0A239EVJ0_9ACTN|nr:ABC-type nitrate/sulfonate/bicarbonate transport system, substrate-binding protein [Actinomadura meyerae]